jgi:small subunit ribosomal protein S6
MSEPHPGVRSCTPPTDTNQPTNRIEWNDLMKNRYEGLLILNVKGTDEGAKELIERLEKDFTKEGAQVEQVQRLDRRQFSYAAGPLDSGYYVNFVFHAEPEAIDRIRSKFKLDEDVYRQHYQRLRRKAVRTEK